MPLFTRRRLVSFENAVDELLHRSNLRQHPFLRFPFRWQRAPQRLSHHPPMYLILCGERQDRLSCRMPPPDLFK
jgi:hypothetical protein